MNFKELKSKEEYKKSYLVMSELVGHLSHGEYMDVLNKMLKEGYRLFVLTDESDKYISIIGLSVRTDFFNGKHIWISELVTSKEVRSKGLGRVLVEEIEKIAIKENCNKVILYSGLSRVEAHNFWENHMNYQKRGIVFKKELK